MNSLGAIIIPTYNRSSFLVATLESVIGQTYSNWECLRTEIRNEAYFFPDFYLSLSLYS